MGWRDLLEQEGSTQVLPWYGCPRVHSAQRTWTISGSQPREHGWYLFNTPGVRNTTLSSDIPVDIDVAWGAGQTNLVGYLVGDRFIADQARVDPDPAKLIDQTVPVFCVERGLARFARATVVRDREGRHVYLTQEFPSGQEDEVLKAYQDRLADLAHVQGVTPALDLAFRWITYQRILADERQKELERLRAEEEKRQAAEQRVQQAMRDAGTAVGRRVLAARDFQTAAREALRVSGAELLDVRDSYRRGEVIVQYRFQQRRLECVVDRATLRIVDSGICLTDHDGTKGDTWFNLESLPGVVGEALRLGKLVVYRHVDGDAEEDRAQWPYDAVEDDDD